MQMRGQRILFISEMKDMRTDASSTQIMTYNLLEGLREIGCYVTFVAVCNDKCDTDSVQSDFSPIVNEVKCLPSALNLLSKKRNLISKILLQILYSYRSGWYMKEINKLQINSEYEIILTHLPAIESAFYVNALRKKIPDARYIQFWSDPYARSGLLSEQKLPMKRVLVKWLEKRILKKADQIIYGTPLLKDTQSREFHQLAYKMSACDVSYNVFEAQQSCGKNLNVSFRNNNPVFGYVGGYKSTYRNIDPLFNVMKKHPELGNLILCGFSDVVRPETQNIRIIPYCSPIEAIYVESQLEIHICLLNRTMSQIPGKIFYQANSEKPILVILDGPDKEKIKKYLQKFNRFEFSDNSETDIYEKLYAISQGILTANTATPELLSPKAFANSVVCC